MPTAQAISIHEDEIREQEDFDNYVNEHYDEIREAYEDMLKETGRYHCELSEVDDGRNEFVKEYMDA